MNRDHLDAAAGPGGLSKQRRAGIALMATGGVFAVIGLVFGGLAAAQKSASKDHCAAAPADDGLIHCRDAEGVDLLNDAFTKSYVSTAGLAVGGALGTLGVLLFATAPAAKPSPSAARVSLVAAPTPAGVAVHIAW